MLNPATWCLFNTSDEAERGVGEAARLAKATAARFAKRPPSYQHPRPPKQHSKRHSKKARREAKAKTKAKEAIGGAGEADNGRVTKVGCRILYDMIYYRQIT